MNHHVLGSRPTSSRLDRSAGPMGKVPKKSTLIQLSSGTNSETVPQTLPVSALATSVGSSEARAIPDWQRRGHLLEAKT